MPSEDTRWPWESDESDEKVGRTQPKIEIRREFSGPSPFVYGSDSRQYAPPQHQLQSNEAFAQEMLTAHNRYRAMHRAQPLALDRDLTRGAQLWAEKMANQDRLVPDVDLNSGTAGENLAMKFNSARTNFSGGEITDNWYGGIEDYDFQNNIPRRRQGSAVLAFTQIVWKGSRSAGFGRAVSRSGKVYAVGRYYPTGNAVGEFRQNVSPHTSAMDGTQTSSPANGTFDSRQTDQSATDTFDNRQTDPTSTTRRGSGTYVTSSRLSEAFGPDIGAMQHSDALLSSTKTTKYENGSTVVTIEEKYAAHDGSTYTRQRKMTYFGEHRKF